VINFLNDSTRKEIKYKVFIKDIDKLYSWLFKSSFKKSFDNRGVNSLYYDTPNLDFAASNISGESRRIKIRARWYTKSNEDFFMGFSRGEQSFQFEAKRKINNQSDKLLISKIFCSSESTISDRQKFLKKELTTKIAIDRKLSQFLIRDVIFVGYNRDYYEHFDSSGVRLTVDKEIVCSKAKPISFSKCSLISSNYLIVELKFKQSENILIKNIMKDFPFRQVRSSKYLYALSKYYRFSY